MGLLTMIIGVILIFAVIILTSAATFYNDILRRKVNSSSACKADSTISSNKTDGVTPIKAAKIALWLNIAAIVLAVGVIIILIMMKGK